MAKRFADRIDREPILLYTLAQAQQARGNGAQAQQTADRALGLNKGDTFDQSGATLRSRPRAATARHAEMVPAGIPHVISTGKPGEIITLFAQRGLAELLHDQGDDALAAKVWEDAVKAREAKEKNKEGDVQDLTNRLGPIETMRARMHFFKACRHGRGEHGRAARRAESRFGGRPDRDRRADRDVSTIRISMPS